MTGKKNTHIVIHHMAGNLSIETCGSVFASSSRQASSNYGIGSDGRVGQYVDETNRSWATSNYGIDSKAVTIEVANSSTGGQWPVSDKAMAKLIGLSSGSSGGTSSSELYRVRKSWADSKSQIGAYKILANAKKKADKNKGYKVFNSSGVCVYPESSASAINAVTANKSVSELAYEVIAGKWGNGTERKNRLTEAGYDYSSVQNKVNSILMK